MRDARLRLARLRGAELPQRLLVARRARRAPAGGLRRAAALLELFLFQKAFYEIGYEAANRPAWLSIPRARRARPDCLAARRRRMTAMPEAAGCAGLAARRRGGRRDRRGPARRSLRRPRHAWRRRRAAVGARLLAGRGKRRGARCADRRGASPSSSSCIPTGSSPARSRAAAAPFPTGCASAPATATWEAEDPYRFPPVLGELDVHLMAEGSHRRIFERLGAHPTHDRGRRRRRLRGVGAERAARQRGRRLQPLGRPPPPDAQARRGRRSGRSSSPASPRGTRLQVRAARRERRAAAAEGRSGRLRSRSSRRRPPRASPACRATTGATRDWMDARRERQALDAPISIYEVHLGSWRRKDGDRFLTYDELADELIPYVKDMGFTHIECLPVSEHPFAGSWGYQPIGLFAPTSRFGAPEAFARFVDRCHQAGIGVIIDWVPAHFPTDAHGLARFDGTALYEHEDPRLGFHRDWNTLIYNFGRTEVRELPRRQRALLAGALPHRRAARRRGRLDALPRLQPQGRRVDPERAWRAREPRGDRLPARAEHPRLRRPSRRDHDRRGIDRLAAGVAAGRRRRARLRLQVEHGLDARHARLHRSTTRSTAATITTR